MLLDEALTLKKGDLVKDARTGNIFRFLDLVKIGLNLETFSYTRKRYFISCEGIEGREYPGLILIDNKCEIPVRYVKIHKRINSL